MKHETAQLDGDIGVGAAWVTACYSELVVRNEVRWSHPYNFDFEDGSGFGWATLVG